MFNSSLNNGAGDNIGTIKAFAGSTAPAGWLICDGSAIDRVLYGALFNVIGETYGAGDGTTTFNLPDMLGFTKNQGVICDYYTYEGDLRYSSMGLISGSSADTSSLISGNLCDRAKGDSNAHLLAKYNNGTNKAVGANESGGSWDGSTNLIGLHNDPNKSGVITTNKAKQESNAIIKY